ncbi:aspartate aminotransferase family protein [Virgibacillus dakarensis]|uniref:aspartate aminotransferase family protein n=1 Tax=Virgibacillus dakarensis TaxID=1917889 RepID=UPI000B433E35|nr:aspartate aminotransferase family protein [Virgibacillus dakarensis]
MKSFSNSKMLLKKSNQYLAAGVSSNLRLSVKPVPIFIEKAKGTKMVDEDGNEYIDYIMAYGPQILGHSHPAIVRAIQEQAEIGQTFGAQHQGEIDLAKRIVEFVPCVEKVSYCSTGTEAVQLALRLARAYTGRKKIIRFDGHYHGWNDTISTKSTDEKNSISYINPKVKPATNGQCEEALNDIIVLPWNNYEVIEKTLKDHKEEIAAVIMEPVMCNSGCISPKQGYLEKIREMTSELGIILIFDEVITGFRLGLGGAQEKLNIKPDLVTLGKAVAGGLPLSVVGGKENIMDLISNNEVVHMGTLNGNPLCTSAAIASINYLANDNGRIYSYMKHLVDHFVLELEKLASRFELPLLVNKQETVFHTMFTSEREVTSYYQFQQRNKSMFSRLAELLLLEGVAVRPSGLWYISTEHTKKDIESTLKIVEKCFHKLSKEYK